MKINNSERWSIHTECAVWNRRVKSYWGKKSGQCTGNFSGPVGEGSHTDYPLCAPKSTHRLQNDPCDPSHRALCTWWAGVHCPILTLTWISREHETKALQLTISKQYFKNLFLLHGSCARHFGLCAAGNCCAGEHLVGCSACTESLQTSVEQPWVAGH